MALNVKIQSLKFNALPVTISLLYKSCNQNIEANYSNALNQQLNQTNFDYIMMQTSGIHLTILQEIKHQKLVIHITVEYIKL